MRAAQRSSSRRESERVASALQPPLRAAHPQRVGLLAGVEHVGQRPQEAEAGKHSEVRW